MPDEPVSLKWFPPSWFQIKASDLNIYIDPAYLRWYYAKYPKKIEFAWWPDEIDGLPEEMEKADLVLITHKHKDHCKRVTVNRIKKDGTTVLAPKHCEKELGADFTVIKPGDERKYGSVTIRVVDAYNTERGSSTRKVHHKGDGVGYVVSAGRNAVYHAGDTDLIPEMRELGAIKVALLPIGGTFTMDIDEAVEAAIAIGPKTVIPMHNAKADMREFKAKLEARSNIEAVPLPIGGSYTLS